MHSVLNMMKFVLKMTDFGAAILRLAWMAHLGGGNRRFNSNRSRLSVIIYIKRRQGTGVVLNMMSLY